MTDWNWVSCNFAEGKKYLFCEECGHEALNESGHAIGDDGVSEIVSVKLPKNSKCCHCGISTGGKC